MAGAEQGASEQTLQAIPVVVAAEPPPADRLPQRFHLTVPRIVDYLIVAIFMFFWL